MKLRSLVTIAALALGTVSGMAQATYTAKDGTEYTFKKHLFLDLQGGRTYSLAWAISSILGSVPVCRPMLGRARVATMVLTRTVSQCL